MKKTFLLFITLILSFICIDNLDAITGYTTEAYVAVRSEPRVASSTFIYQFPSSNATLDIIETNLHNVGDPSCSIGWYKINYNGREAYICGKYVSIGALPDDNLNYNEQTFEARVTDTRVSVRPGPTYSNSSYYELLPGTNVTILEKVTGQVSSRCSDGWYKVRYYKNSTGYICAAYVNTKEELTASDAEYENYLRGLGFPDSYLPYLVKLHQLHPNWTFNPIITNTDWDSLIKVETNSNAVIYNYYLNDIIFPIYQKGPLSGESGWYITTDGVNAFFLDPRNFLTEKFIFMFERLNYNYAGEEKGNFNKDSNQARRYYNMVSYVLKGAYSDTDEYKNWFIEAGYNANVSPVYLTSLSYQEGPLSNPNNASIIGTHSLLYYDGNGVGHDVNGYYNFFNINANKVGVNGTITRALAYACGSRCGYQDTYDRPWDNKKDAIFGGSKWIYNDYISIGQNTMYLKKFNTNPAPGYSLGGHQYQTNITAPCSESLKLYTAYKETGEINNNFSFDIPIYKNMPSATSLPEIASTINTLNEIKVNGKKISNDIDILEYEVYVPVTSNSAKIEVVKTDEKSTVKGDGEITLTGDRTEHKVIVTAENGSTKTYTITLIKADDDKVGDMNITIEDVTEGLSVTNDNTINHISPSTVVDTIKQSILKKSPTTNVTVYNNNGQVIEGATPLSTGNTIKITVPSGATKTYTIIVNGDVNGDGKVDILDLLKIQKQLLKTTLLNNLETKGADTNFDGKIDILDLLLVQKYILGTSNL